MGDTKEQILSLLSHGAKVKIVDEDQNIVTLVHAYDRYIMGEYAEEYRVDKVNREKVKILQVIPSTRPEYKVGDKVMYWFYDEWSGPKTIRTIVEQVGEFRESDYEIGVTFIGEDYFMPFSLLAPFHEGVQYNALPDRVSDAI